MRQFSNFYHLCDDCGRASTTVFRQGCNKRHQNNVPFEKAPWTLLGRMQCLRTVGPDVAAAVHCLRLQASRLAGVEYCTALRTGFRFWMWADKPKCLAAVAC